MSRTLLSLAGFQVIISGRFWVIAEALLRQIEVELANHKSIGQACKEAGITQQTYYRWRKEYGGLKLEQARRLKELEKENSRLRRLVTELSLEKLVLKDVAEGNF